MNYEAAWIKLEEWLDIAEYDMIQLSNMRSGEELTKIKYRLQELETVLDYIKELKELYRI